MKFNLRLLYLYLFSFVGLLIVVIASIQMVDLGLKTFVFTDVDTYEMGPAFTPEGKPIEPAEEAQARQQRELRRSRQRQLTTAFSMLVVGAPLYLYHWGLIKKEGN